MSYDWLPSLLHLFQSLQWELPEELLTQKGKNLDWFAWRTEYSFVHCKCNAKRVLLHQHNYNWMIYCNCNSNNKLFCVWTRFIQSFQTCLGITLRTCKAGFGRLLSSTSWNPPPHNFYRFLQVSTSCKLVANHFDRPISYIFPPVPANLFFIVMTTGQELGHW